MPFCSFLATLEKSEISGVEHQVFAVARLMLKFVGYYSS
jgi:hypothetical protein